jgi:ERCC4-type nuclease
MTDLPGGFLVVDDREPHTMQEAVLRAVPTAQVLRLSIGDFVIHDKCGHALAIERKDVSDLLHSMADGRLQHQVPRLDTFDHSMLLIEGCWKMDVEDKSLMVRGRKSKWKATSVHMILLGHQRNWPNLTVLHTSSAEETVAVLKTLEGRARKGCVLRASGDGCP